MNIFPILILLILAGVLLLVASRTRASLGVPKGRVIYADMDDQLRVDQPLFDSDLNLVGRPDYLVRSGNELIPVEVKSGRAPAQPYESHVYQLAAYCVLVARQYGRRPTHGLIRYSEKSFRVEFTAQLERELLALLQEMRANMDSPNLQRSHNQPSRCRACGYLELCDQSL